ncbi:MAG TPA: zf-HC2 domain-containing protein [Anaerolineales bacterium]|nr:zf-HC2 domain-containing protein [Anaerolineales bacterium]
MNCREVRELIPWYAARSLPPEEREELILHLAGCASCQAELAQAVRLVWGVREAVQRLPGVPGETWGKVLARTRGIPVGRLDLGSFLLGISVGLSVRVREGRVPLTGELRVLGRRVPLFEIGGGAR